MAGMMGPSRRTRVLSVLGAVLWVASACSSDGGPVDVSARGEESATADGLHRVPSTWVAAAFVRPGASLAEYHGIVIDPLLVSYKDGTSGEMVTNRARGSFALGAATTERIARTYREAFQRELARSDDFALVAEPGAGVLRVVGRLVNLVVTAPPMRGGEENYLIESGEMTLILDVRDARTGQALFRFADRRAIRPASGAVVSGYQSNAVNNWGAMREIFADWARFSREEIEALHSAPPAAVPE